MIIESLPEHLAPGVFVRFRYRVSKLIYESMSGLIVRAGGWQEELFGSLAPKAGERILDFGRGNSSTSISLALRYPEAKVVAMESSCEAARRVRSKAIRRRILNLSVVVAPPHGPLPFHAGSFDKVVCRLGLHDFAPNEKLAILKEIARVIRRGRTFHVADFDKAESPGEGGILELASRISGPVAVAAHVDGSWTEFLVKAGFASVRRRSSHSIGFGRISVVKARKR
jgi:ubiquinone/menaquinone biosynthesis C-methylase UbiE